jgi:hypothetical protein
MEFRISALDTPLRKEPSLEADIKRFLPHNTDIGECDELDGGLWLKADFGNRDDQKGFVLLADCKDKTGEPPPDFDRGGFVDACVTSEFLFNNTATIKPWHVLADFLIARAIIETDIKPAGSLIPGSDGVGPLQVTKAEWNDFVQNGGKLVSHRDESIRKDPIRQIDAAAFRMHTDMKTLSALRTDTAAKNDPFVPEFLDVFFAYLTDSPAAALALREAFSNKANHDQPVTKFLRHRAHSNDEIMTEAQVRALFKAREKFFGTEASPKSLKDVVSKVETDLTAALKQGFDDIKQFVPEAVPLPKVAKSDFEAGGPAAGFKAKAPIIMRQLMTDFGFKDFQAAGILGNLGHETGGFTLFQERKPRAGRGGFGWAQWTGSRRVDFENFCRQHGFAVTSDEGNYAFLKHEMQNTSEKKVVPLLKATTTLEKAVEVFETVYERAGVVAMDRRIGWARRAMEAFAGNAAADTPGSLASKLKAQIAAGKITFQLARLRGELLQENSGTKVTEKLQSLILRLCDFAPKIEISSLVRTGTASHHTLGRAIDIGNEQIAGALLPVIGTDAKVAELQIDELIFDARLAGQSDANKWNYDEGRKHSFGPGTIAQHGNHIHISVKPG